MKPPMLNPERDLKGATPVPKGNPPNGNCRMEGPRLHRVRIINALEVKHKENS